MNAPSVEELQRQCDALRDSRRVLRDKVRDLEAALAASNARARLAEEQLARAQQEMRYREEESELLEPDDELEPPRWLMWIAALTVVGPLAAAAVVYLLRAGVLR